ncbi:MAG TPA: methyltransferase domain-containing protein [Chloroflexota bacterium]|jgi:trans-aconitate 2-methyltransferase
MAPSTWNPEQYARFRNERSRPYFDLLALVQPQPDMRVVDLGCGTGELTRVLHEQLQARETVGLDSSETMLAKSAAFADNGLRFEQGDIAGFQPDHEYDLIFSNAALHWLSGHEELLSRLTRGLTPGGQLAFQVPANNDHPTHVVAAALARQSPFREAMGGYDRQWPNLTPVGYAQLLDQLGYRAQLVRLQVYVHHLPSREDVVEWVKGSLLTDYEQRLSPALFAQFLARYREQLLPQLDDSRPYLFPFKRILCWGKQ